MRGSWKHVLLAASLLWVAGTAGRTAAAAEAGAAAGGEKPRLVLVNVPHWKVKFFGLPEELPVLLAAGEKFDPSSRIYDFGAGMKAMEVFLALRPKDPVAPAYRQFLRKWPIYQEFFKSIDAEAFAEARELLQKIQDIAPRDPAVYFYRGSLNMQLGDYAAAEKQYRRCLELYPGYIPAGINLARLALNRNSKNDAEEYLRQAVAQNTEDGLADAKSLAEQMLKQLREK